MKIKFLGTAALEGVPSPFCRCDVCKASRAKGGRNMRSRSQALINDELLLEFNPDTVWHFQRYAFDFDMIGDCLITHAHSDHLYAPDIEIAADAFTHEHNTINFYAAKSGYEIIKEFTDRPNSRAKVALVTAGRRFTTSKGYTVLPLEADHDKSADPVIYLIEKTGKRLLYAHDTGYFPESSWALLKACGRLDLVSLDCTGCIGKRGEWRMGHMTFGTNLEVISRMKSEGIIDDDTILIANHFSHNGGQTYDEMQEYTQRFGVITSFDGMEVEF